MFTYILQIILFQLLFLAVYEVLLKKETFFTWNRWYLLVTSVASLLLPFIEIEMLSFWLPRENISDLTLNWLTVEGTAESANTGIVATSPSVSNFNINWWYILYLVGAVISIHLLLKKYSELSRLFRFRTIASEKDFQIIEVPNSTIACTFNKTIFLGSQLSEAEKQEILTHELVHVKQKHSLDLVFFEMLKIIFWFNPLIYIYQNRITTMHEYIADAEVVKVTTKREYYEQLLNSAFGTKDISFINQFFNHSFTRLNVFGKTITFGNSGGQVKKRIIMLQRSRSNTTAKLKYLALLPVMLLMLSFVAFSGTGIDTMTINDIDPNATAQQLEIPFAVVEQIPVYPGCEAETGEANKDCFDQRIKEYVLRNYNTNRVKPYLKEGSNRIILVFTIGSNGEVMGAKSRMVTPGIPVEYKAIMEEEANRVAQTIPKMKPGMHEGKAVGVSYSLPLEIFNTGEVE